jgi:TolB-like protein
MKSGLISLVFFLLASSICIAGGNKEKTQPKPQTQTQPQTQQKTQQQPQIQQQTALYWQGDGGKGIRLAVLEPTSKTLSVNELWIPSMIQSSMTADFQKYSAMTIVDRQNLEKILNEQNQSLSGNYSDDDFISIGKLTNARYILAGSITKTSSSFMLELAVTDAESGERKASYPPKAVSPFALENLSAIKEATVELLNQLGVRLTNTGLRALNSTANIAQVKAETALAKGIEAQKQGTTVEALSYFIQASNYNSGLAEAVSRMNILTANISSGNIGQDTRNDIAWRRQWVARLQETEAFFANSLKGPQPFYIVYSTDIKQGKVDYQKEVTDLNIWMGFYPDYVWADQINEVINAVKKGLQTTGRAQVWELDWPAKSISNPSPFINQTKNSTSTVVIEVKDHRHSRWLEEAPLKGAKNRDVLVFPDRKSVV